MYRLGSGSLVENIDINVNGYFSRGLFKGDRFEGTINIGDKELQKLDMMFAKDKGGILFYYDETTGDYTSHGQIYFDNKREKIAITVFDQSRQDKSKKNWSSNNGLMISAPANNRAEALEISNELLKETLENKLLK
jgi:hypothetical protein